MLTTDATPNDRLQAYIEIEFERLAKSKWSVAVDRSDEGVAFEEELEGGNGGEISMEQMWGQYKFGDPFSVRFGQILASAGPFQHQSRRRPMGHPASDHWSTGTSPCCP